LLPQSKGRLQLLKEQAQRVLENFKRNGEREGGVVAAYFEPDGPFLELSEGMDGLIDVLSQSAEKRCLVSIVLWKPVMDKLMGAFKKMEPETLECFKKSLQQPMVGGWPGKDPMMVVKDTVERIKNGGLVDVTEFNEVIEAGVAAAQKAFSGVMLPPQVQLALRVPGIETIVQQVLIILDAQLMEDIKALQKEEKNEELKKIHKKILGVVNAFFAMVVKAGFGILKKSWHVADGIIDDMAYMLGDIKDLQVSSIGLKLDERSAKIIAVMSYLDVTHAKQRKKGGSTRRKRTRKRKPKRTKKHRL
jgi:hypothetical protein